MLLQVTDVLQRFDTSVHRTGGLTLQEQGQLLVLSPSSMRLCKHTTKLMFHGWIHGQSSRQANERCLRPRKSALQKELGIACIS